MHKALLGMLGSVTLAVAGFGMHAAHAQGDPAAGYKWPVLPWKLHRMAPDVYWIEGGGGNSGVIVGRHSLIVFDAKTTAETGKELLGWIRRISDKPISTVILSHSDVDHVGGLRVFPAGITIIAHATALKELKADLAADPGTALPARFLPTRVIDRNAEDVTIDGVRMRLLHWAPAHTGGDLMLYLPNDRILFGGDVITQNRPHPLLHREKGGSSSGWVATLQGMLGVGASRFVPGHGDVMTPPAIRVMLQDAERERATIRRLAGEGKSLKEIEDATGDPSPEEKAGPPFAPFSEVVYREVTEDKGRR